MITDYQLDDLQKRAKMNKDNFQSFPILELMDTLTAALKVVRAAQSICFARYGIAIPLTENPDILSQSFEEIQDMFKPLQEALKPFQAGGGE